MSYFAAEQRENFTNDLLAFTLINEDTVEKILDTRITQHNQRVYKVKWKDSWLLEDQLKEHCCELIKRFWRFPPVIHDPYQLPCFGKTFSTTSTTNGGVPAGDMLSELVFSEEQHSVSHNHLMPLSLDPKGKNTTHDQHLIHPAVHNESAVVNNPLIQNTHGAEASSAHLFQSLTAAADTSQSNSSKQVETQEESDEMPEDAVTVIENLEILSKICLDCNKGFTTKCKHCRGCRSCRKNTKCHFYECFGDKICAICGHCFEGEECKICCPYCGQVYPTVGHWRRHVRVTHLGLDTRPSIARKRRERALYGTSKTRPDARVEKERTSKCLTCGKGFVNPHKLKRHEKIHSDVKDFKCHVCDKGFVQKVHLQKHLLQHGIGEKRFKCHNCDKWFNHKISLKTHLPKCASSHLT